MHARKLSIPIRLRPNIPVALSLLTIVLLLLALAGCMDADNSAFASNPTPWTPPRPVVTPPTIPPDQIELSGVAIEHTNWIGLTDDPRPVWIVSGRIRNNSGKYLDGLRLHFFFKNGKTTPPRADTYLDLDNYISPSTEDSFSSRIQLPRPQRGWNLYSEVVEARARSH